MAKRQSVMTQRPKVQQSRNRLRRQQNEKPFSENEPAVYLNRFRCAALPGRVQQLSEHFAKRAHLELINSDLSSERFANVKPGRALVRAGDHEYQRARP